MYPDPASTLQAAFGPDVILTSASDRAAFERDWRGRTAAQACAVALPRDVAMLQELVRSCRLLGVAVVPQGGNTGLCGGSVPCPGLPRPQLIVSLRRLDRVRRVDSANDTLTVEAGCTLQVVKELAAQHDRLFPLSLASEGSCQIGGNLATNAGGVQVLRYGSMRALTLGLEVVLPDGRLWDGLRALRKDNTGYDLKQVFIGAEGTLGIITAATLRLFARPRTQALAWLGLGSPQTALDLFHALKQAFGEQVSSYELIGRFPLELALRHLPGARDPLAAVHPWQVLLQVDDQDATALADGLQQVADQRGGGAPLFDDAVVAQSDAQAQALWLLRENLSEAQRIEGHSLKHDISLPIARIPEFIERAGRSLDAADPGVRIVCFGHLGDGNLHYNLFPAAPAASAADVVHARGRLTRVVHDLVADFDGSFSAEHGIGQFKVDELARYRDPVTLDLMHSLKRAWDPENLMNPGKLFAHP